MDASGSGAGYDSSISLAHERNDALAFIDEIMHLFIFAPGVGLTSGHLLLPEDVGSPNPPGSLVTAAQQPEITPPPAASFSSVVLFEMRNGEKLFRSLGQQLQQ